MRALVILALSAAAAYAQAFDVTSVKPNHRGELNFTYACCEPFSAENIPLKNMIRIAWNIGSAQLVGGATWMDEDRWDVRARSDGPADASPAGEARGRLKLQTLLRDRFHLELHSEQRRLAAFTLMVDRGKPKLQTSSPTAALYSKWSDRSIRGDRMSMDALAQILNAVTGRTVSNDTGLAGEYTVNVDFAKQDSDDTKHPDLFTVLREQLGLKLESRKGPVDVLVIEHADKASEN